MVHDRKRTRVAVVTLGCPKNQVDSGIMETALSGGGFSITRSGYADAVILNTCGFIEAAKEESIEEILRFIRLKKEGKVGKVLVGGCLSQRYREELEEEIPEVDRYFGISEISSVDRILDEMFVEEGNHIAHTMKGSMETLYLERVSRMGQPWAYLKISEGCSNHCAYCVIPRIRGRLESRERKWIIAEFQEMVGKGIKEVNLIGQDIASYGNDRNEDCGLANLLRELTEEDCGEIWIRLLYLHPLNISDDLIKVIGERRAVVKYLDVPIQHGSTNILERMNRRYTREHLRDLFRRIRGEIDEAVLRTTVMVGFPGETERDFGELLEFIEEIGFDHLGGFVYSREGGSTSFSMENQVPNEVAQDRLEELLTVQSEISFSKKKAYLGKELTLLLEEQEGEILKGRYYGQAPEIDGNVSLSGSDREYVGDFIRAKIVGTDHYDLRAKISK